MIFSRFFTPKWKSKKAHQRLLAVSQLENSVPEQHQILSQLAKTDSDEKVRIAALKRINDIALWWQVYQQQDNSNIAKLAENELFTGQHISSLTQQQLTELSSRVVKPAYLATLLPLFSDIDTKISLLKRINQKQMVINVFKESDESEQLALMPIMTQYGLQKTIEKFGHKQLKEQLKAQIEAQNLAKSKPLEVLKQAKLILAKLNALRDKNDFEACDKQHKSLLEQWQSIDLTWLSNPKEQEEKYLEISEKLARHLTQLKQTHDKQQQLIKRAELVQSTQGKCTALVEQVADSLNKVMSEPQKVSTTESKLALSNLKAEIEELKSLGENSQQFESQFTAFNEQIEAIDLIRPQLISIAELIAQSHALPVANDFLSFDEAQIAFDNWHNQFTQLNTALPKRIKDSYSAEVKAISATWKAQHRVLVKQIRDSQNAIAKQLNDVKRLINAGRFKLCFGIFKGVQADYLALPLSSQKKLSRDYDDISLKLSEVNEWQQQISLPKRHELLAEVAQKLNEQNIDIRARSEWIKLTRKRWNELGYISTDEEKHLDNQFNTQLELAFSPCREFYAQLEQLRAKNVEKRHALIERFQSISNSLEGADVGEIEKQYFKLKQLWRDAGEVDNQQYKSLLKQLKPYESKIKQFIKIAQKAIAEQKTQLIEQAKKALNEQSIDSTIESLKSLQSKWKLAGFASKKVETRLWQEFRAVNDQAFAKRDELRKALASEQQAVLDTLTTRFKAIAQSQAGNTLVDIQQSKSSLEELAKELKEHSLKSSLNNQIAKHIEHLDKQIEALKNNKHRAKFEALFASLEQREIPSQWQQTSAASISRHRTTIRLEIANELDSTDEDAALRLEEQISLLQDKVKGNIKSNHELLKMWLSHGDIDEQALSLLARIKPIFVG